MKIIAFLVIGINIVLATLVYISSSNYKKTGAELSELKQKTTVEKSKRDTLEGKHIAREEQKKWQNKHEKYISLVTEAKSSLDKTLSFDGKLYPDLKKSSVSLAQSKYRLAFYRKKVEPLIAILIEDNETIQKKTNERLKAEERKLTENKKLLASQEKKLADFQQVIDENDLTNGDDLADSIQELLDEYEAKLTTNKEKIETEKEKQASLVAEKEKKITRQKEYLKNNKKLEQKILANYKKYPVVHAQNNLDFIIIKANPKGSIKPGFAFIVVRNNVPVGRVIVKEINESFLIADIDRTISKKYTHMLRGDEAILEFSQ